MKTSAGLWIDHGKATIVLLRHGIADVFSLKSAVEPQTAATGGTRCSRPFWHRSVSPANENHLRRGIEAQRFYEVVMKALGTCEPLWICGPGLAKIEFCAFLGDHGFPSASIVGPDSAPSRISTGELVAMVRAQFHEELPRFGRLYGQEAGSRKSVQSH